MPPLRICRYVLILAACAALFGCSMKAASSPDGLPPLGSAKNPILCDSVRGEREYLARLRCDDGKAPAFGSLGSLGRGADGHTVDRYLVQCEGEETVDVYMDYFHTAYREKVPIPGFDIVEQLPTVGSDVCPPELPYPGYAFISNEVAQSARLLNEPPVPAPENEMPAVLELVIGTDGVVEIDTIRVLMIGAGDTQRSLAVNLLRFRFSPAEHHPGCPVRQRINGKFLLDRSLS